MLINENNPHGGQIYKGEARKIKADFSVNLNPQGIPEKVLAAAKKAISISDRYPDAECTELREAIASKENVMMNHIICGNGGAELIFQLAAALRPKKALVVEPTFSEYRQSAEVFGGRVRAVMTEPETGADEKLNEILQAIDEEKAEIVFLCNPNNPTGRVTKIRSVKTLLKKCEEKDALLFVDESFGELTDSYKEFSAVNLVEQNKNLFILKSMTKTYAIPGLRAGYGLCSDEELLKRLCGVGQCWNLSTVAQKAAAAAIRECGGYMEKSPAIVRREREYLRNELKALGIQVFESEANYMLIRAAATLKDDLLKRGILIRSCGNFPGLDERYFRVAVRSHGENVLLVETLKKMKEEGDLCTEQA